jgi:hypothetical protein
MRVIAEAATTTGTAVPVPEPAVQCKPPVVTATTVTATAVTPPVAKAAATAVPETKPLSSSTHGSNAAMSSGSEASPNSAAASYCSSGTTAAATEDLGFELVDKSEVLRSMGLGTATAATTNNTSAAGEKENCIIS